jgi:hypothetical protein
MTLMTSSKRRILFGSGQESKFTAIEKPMTLSVVLDDSAAMELSSIIEEMRSRKDRVREKGAAAAEAAVAEAAPMPNGDAHQVA